MQLQRPCMIHFRQLRKSLKALLDVLVFLEVNMKKKPILYHGTNSNDRVFYSRNGKLLVALFHRFWTTDPGEAMDFSFTSARKFNGEMILLALPVWTPEYFKFIGERCAVNRGNPCHWYRSTLWDLLDRDHNSLEQKSVKVYSQSELEDFVKTYCQDKEAESRWLQNYISLLKKNKEKK